MEGIRKTKTNIFLLFLLGLIIGAVCALRHPAPTAQPEQPIAAVEQAEQETVAQQPTGENE